MNTRKGQTSIDFKGLIDDVDAMPESTGNDNRSENVRAVLRVYFALKKEGVDILKMDEKKMVKELMKL